MPLRAADHGIPMLIAADYAGWLMVAEPVEG